MPHRETSLDVLRLGERIVLLPVVHGSGDMAVAVRRYLLDHPCDVLAVPLPESFRVPVEAAVKALPNLGLVIQREPIRWGDPAAEDFRPLDDADPESSTADAPDDDADADDAGLPRASYVPIDPCQPVIAALRLALEERIPRAYIDAETERFEPYSASFPDPYALKRVTLGQFAAAVLPGIGPLPHDQARLRVAEMARRLRELEGKFTAVAAIVSILDWPWLREAYAVAASLPAAPEADVETPRRYHPSDKTTLFMLGELPFITSLYESARGNLEDDENLSVDGVKELLLAARDSYKQEFGKQSRKLPPLLLRQMLKYIRNLCLIDRRLTPDLYTLVIAAKQMAGDQFARHVAEKAREYPHRSEWATTEPVVLGVGQGRLPDGETVKLVNRLPGPPMVWRKLELVRKADNPEKKRWESRWNPYSQCSWPPEDEQIESFRTTLVERAKQLLGMDLARSEKFTTSLRDGLDIRETLRNWHTGDLFVKIVPPSRGKLDCVVMLFDVPADPREYSWRSTWFAEHQNESTLAFFATDFRNKMVGPGVAVATYGGAMFLFPPRTIRCIWRDKEFDRNDTVEERIIDAACCHSQSRHVVLLSPVAPTAPWRRLASDRGKKLIHLPLGNFSAATIAQLRLMHVLNGREVRSYAADFIRKA